MEMQWKIEGYGRFESRQEGAPKQDQNNTATRHGSIKRISKTQSREKDIIDLSTVYWSSTQPNEKPRFMSRIKSTGGVSETPRG